MFKLIAPMFKLIALTCNLIAIACCVALLPGCTAWQAFKTAETIVTNYPSDNIIEEIGEDYAEEYFDLEEGSLDFSLFSPEE